MSKARSSDRTAESTEIMGPLASLFSIQMPTWEVKDIENDDRD